MISAWCCTMIASTNCSPSPIVEIADKIPYQAKNKGRNCVEYAAP